MIRAVFLGTGAIAAPALEALAASPSVALAGVVACPDLPAGRGRKTRPGPVASLARQLGLPLMQPPKLRAPDAVAALAAWEPDLLVVMAYGQILSREVLGIPSIAAINLHASILPRHRGASPVQAALLAGDTATGITVMFMDEGLDTGDIMLVEEVAIAPGETAASLGAKLAAAAPSALRKALGLIASGDPPRRPQDGSLATYAPKIKKEDGLIDWTLAPGEIARRTRAYDPWPGCFTYLPSAAGGANALFKIWKAEEVPGARLAGHAPGVVVESSGGRLAVAAGGGLVSVLEAQLEGRRRMPVRDLLLGHAIPPGTRFVSSRA